MDKDRQSHHRATRSVRLKKYEAVYKEHMKKYPVESKNEKPPKLTSERPEIIPQTSDSKKKKNLNEYQHFVKEESKKEKYKNMKGAERLAAIAQIWKKKRKKKNT
jgi:hypothetical protein